MNQASLLKKVPHLLALVRLDRPIGIFLLLWPMLWALWFAADGVPSLDVLVIFITGTVLTRSAGCAINDFADRRIDAHVARTRARPLATGVLAPRDALITAAVLMAVAFMLVLFTNRLTILLSFAALALASAYPFAKRYTHFPQIVLGIAFAFAIPMAWAAETGTMTALTGVLFLAAVLWAVGYDTLYAMADRDDDLRIGVKSTAIFFGRADLVVVAITQFLVILLLFKAGAMAGRGPWYDAGVLAAVGFTLYQLWLARKREPARCIQAFLNNNYLGLTVFTGLVLDYAFAGASGT